LIDEYLEESPIRNMTFIRAPKVPKKEKEKNRNSI